jgi:hypothetical protein
MKKFRKKYLVVFTATAKNGYDTITGNCSAYFNCEPPTFEDIRNAQEELKKSNGFISCIITNWLRLSE